MKRSLLAAVLIALSLGATACEIQPFGPSNEKTTACLLGTGISGSSDVCYGR